MAVVAGVVVVVAVVVVAGVAVVVVAAAAGAGAEAGPLDDEEKRFSILVSTPLNVGAAATDTGPATATTFGNEGVNLASESSDTALTDVIGAAEDSS
ncbi:hypothetical protein V6N13_070090 [Hibiscus sabdariffa]